MALLQTVALTTTILARLFIEPDAARAPSTPSRKLNLAARNSACCGARLSRRMRSHGAQATVAQARLNLSSYTKVFNRGRKCRQQDRCKPATMCSPAKRRSRPSRPKTTSSQTSRRPTLRTCAWANLCGFGSTPSGSSASMGISIAFNAEQVRTSHCFLGKCDRELREGGPTRSGQDRP
jgi:hypothetical protein